MYLFCIPASIFNSLSDIQSNSFVTPVNPLRLAFYLSFHLTMSSQSSVLCGLVPVEVINTREKEIKKPGVIVKSTPGGADYCTVSQL